MGCGGAFPQECPRAAAACSRDSEGRVCPLVPLPVPSAGELWTSLSDRGRPDVTLGTAALLPILGALSTTLVYERDIVYSARGSRLLPTYQAHQGVKSYIFFTVKCTRTHLSNAHSPPTYCIFVRCDLTQCLKRKAHLLSNFCCRSYLTELVLFTKREKIQV